MGSRENLKHACKVPRSLMISETDQSEILLYRVPGPPTAHIPASDHGTGQAVTARRVGAVSWMAKQTSQLTVSDMSHPFVSRH